MSTQTQFRLVSSVALDGGGDDLSHSLNGFKLFIVTQNKMLKLVEEMR